MAATGNDGLAAMVRRVVDDNVYMVLGTADAAGRPWGVAVPRCREPRC